MAMIAGHARLGSDGLLRGFTARQRPAHPDDVPLEVWPSAPLGAPVRLDPANRRCAVVAEPSAPSYAEARSREYPRIDALVVALWERIVEGRTATSDSIQAKRAEIKAKYPKV